MYKDSFEKLAHSETNINTEKFAKYFEYQNPTILLKSLLNPNETKNEKLVKHVNNALINLRHAVNKEKIPNNEHSDKVINIAEEIINFNKQQKWKGPKILTPKNIYKHYKY